MIPSPRHRFWNIPEPLPSLALLSPQSRPFKRSLPYTNLPKDPMALRINPKLLPLAHRAYLNQPVTNPPHCTPACLPSGPLQPLGPCLECPSYIPSLSPKATSSGRPSMVPQGALSHHHAPRASALPSSSRERFSYCFWCIHPSTVSPSPDAAPCPHSPPSPTAWDMLAQSPQ